MTVTKSTGQSPEKTSATDIHFVRNVIIKGLALFLAEGFFRRFRLPTAFVETVAVNRRFMVNPLIPLLSERDLFFVLALSQNQVRLLRGWK